MQLKVAIAVAATRSGMTRDEDSNLPSRLRLGHGIPTIQGPRLGDVARAQIVPPRTGATRSTRGVRPGVFFTHIMKQGKSKASAEDILRRVAHAQFAKHSEGSVAVTQAETPRQPYDVQVVGTNTTTGKSNTSIACRHQLTWSRSQRRAVPDPGTCAEEPSPVFGQLDYGPDHGYGSCLAEPNHRAYGARTCCQALHKVGVDQ